MKSKPPPRPVLAVCSSRYYVAANLSLSGKWYRKTECYMTRYEYKQLQAHLT